MVCFRVFMDSLVVFCFVFIAATNGSGYRNKRTKKKGRRPPNNSFSCQFYSLAFKPVRATEGSPERKLWESDHTQLIFKPHQGRHKISNASRLQTVSGLNENIGTSHLFKIGRSAFDEFFGVAASFSEL